MQNIAWSPDGTKIAFEVKHPSSDASEIWVVDAGDGGPVVDPDTDERIRVRIAGEHPAWSSDGQKIVANYCLGGMCGLWLFDFLGGREEQLTFDSTDAYPTWTQVDNSDYIAFVRGIGDDWEIQLLKLGDEAPQPLTSRGDINTTPVFGPNGRKIYVYTNYEGCGEHWRIEAIGIDDSVPNEIIISGIGESKLHGLVRPAIPVLLE